MNQRHAASLYFISVFVVRLLVKFLVPFFVSFVLVHTEVTGDYWEGTSLKSRLCKYSSHFK